MCFSPRGLLKGIFNQAHRYDIGCMMLAFTVFWAYISFSQYFIIYNANIPEETFWYNLREKAGWWSVSMALIFGQFLAPFLFLLWYKTKVVVWRSFCRRLILSSPFSTSTGTSFPARSLRAMLRATRPAVFDQSI